VNCELNESELKFNYKLIKNELKLNLKLSTWMNIQMNEFHDIGICDKKRQVATKFQTCIMFLLLEFISPNYNLSIIRIHILIIRI